MKWLIDNDSKGFEIDFEYKDYPDVQLISAALDGDMDAQAELDRRASDEVVQDMKKAGIKQSEINDILRKESELPKAVEPELVKVYRNAIDQAIDKLNALTADDQGRIEVPWVQHTRPKIETERWADAKLRSFLIEELQATQKYVKRETVQWHIEHLNDSAHDNRAMPNVLVADTEYLIYDGHHRLVALWLLGADTANCWKLEI